MTYDKALSEIGVNKEETLRRFSGNEALMEKFVRKFPQDKTIDELVKAVGDKNYDGIETSAHTIKGVSGNLGFTRLYESSAALVNAVRAKDYASADAMAPGVIDLCHSINKIIESIDA